MKQSEMGNDIVSYPSSSRRIGQDECTRKLSGWSLRHFQRFMGVKDKAQWEDPKSLFGFSASHQVATRLNLLTIKAGYPHELRFTVNSPSVGQLCASALEEFLSRRILARDRHRAIEKAMSQSNSVKHDSLIGYMGARFDQLEEETRAFNELSSTDLHPMLRRHPLQGPFQMDRVGCQFVPSDKFMKELTDLLLAVSSGAQQEPLTNPSACRDYCIKIGKELLRCQHRHHPIHPSMSRVLNHLLSSGKRLDGDKTKGLLVFCMASCGQLDSGNWKDAVVPKWMESYFERQMLHKPKRFEVLSDEDTSFVALGNLLTEAAEGLYDENLDCTS